MTANAEKALYEQLPPAKPQRGAGRPHGRWFIKPVDALGKPADAGKPDGESRRLDSMQVNVDPRAEWKQMYREVWRIERDFFYDPNLHGANIEALIAKPTSRIVDRLMSRGDLNYLFADMLGDITAQHVYIRGGDRPAVKQVPGGLLGADYTIENNRYRFARVYRGENWNPDLRAPLTEPGVNVREGEYLLAVNGRDVRGTDELFTLLPGDGGQVRAADGGADADGAGARDGHRRARSPTSGRCGLRAWMDDNRRKVDRAERRPRGVRLSARHRRRRVTPTSTATTSRSRTSRRAIIDERFNGGGLLADYIVDWLKRPLLAAAMNREGRDNHMPQSDLRAEGDADQRVCRLGRRRAALDVPAA